MRSTSLLLIALGISAADNSVVLIDGSSTVYPITVAVAERYVAQNPQANIEVLVSGSSAGIRRFLAGEIPIADSSRTMNEGEREKAARNGIDYIELPVAYDGLTVVVSRKNAFVDKLTLEELRHIWRADSPAQNWREVRASWPASAITCFSPGKDSGTWDYFTETVNGKARSQRADASESEDDQVLVQGTVGNPNAIAYFGISYYLENTAMLKAVPIDAGKGPVAPDATTVRNGSYHPLSRPLFIYVNKAEARKRPAVAAFVDGYLRFAPKVAAEVGYVSLDEKAFAGVTARWQARTSGSILATPHDQSRLAETLIASLADSPRAAPTEVATASNPAVAAVPLKTPAPATPPVQASTATMVAKADPNPAIVAAPAVVTAPVAPAIVVLPARTESAKPVPTPSPSPAPRPVIIGDAFAGSLVRAGDASLAMARVAIDQSSTLEDIESRLRQLSSELAAVQAAIPDRRLLEAAIASGIDRLRTSALDLVRQRQAKVETALLREAALHAADAAARDQVDLLAGARSRPELEALRQREEAIAQFRRACERWIGEVSVQP